MKTFREHLLVEKQYTAGDEMEYVTLAAGGGPKYKPKKIPASAGLKLIKKAGGKKGTKATKPGTTSPTKNWTSYFHGSKVDGTPKTDLLILDKRISLKTFNKPGDAVSLIGAGKYEVQALFYEAIQRGKMSPDKQIKKIERFLKQLSSENHYTSEVKGSPAKVKASLKSKVFNDAEALRQKFNKEAGDIFNNNKSFAYHMTYLAMTGEAKFGKNSPATADHFMLTDYTGDKAEIHRANDRKYITKVTSKTKFFMRLRNNPPTKDNPGYPRLRRAIKLTVSKLMESVDNLEYNMLTEEELITEIKGLWNKFTSALKKIFQKILSWIGDSWQRLFMFFDLEPEITFEYPE